METIEKTVSNLILRQFPAFYEQEGPIFILFVQKYYEWLESQNHVLYHSRRLFEYKDIDETTEDFLVHFKETYLKNIQLGTKKNIRQLIKHSLDLYRSKSSERALKLLFQAAFATTPKVYYPGDDIFKLSDGKWVIPTYLEISLSNRNASLVNKQVVGTLSGATAFVDAVVRQSGRKISDILYISALNGDFQTGEQLDFSFATLPADDRPTIIGSLTNIDLDVNGTGAGFIVGDVVDQITSAHGFGAKARVAEIATSAGVVSYLLVDGGYGYSSNTVVILSENVLTVTGANAVPQIFDEIVQPLCTYPYVNLSVAGDSSAPTTPSDVIATSINSTAISVTWAPSIDDDGVFAADSLVYTYYANDDVSGTGRIISVDASNSTSGNLFIEILSGNLHSNAIYTAGNSVSANLDVLVGYLDRTATANIMHVEPTDEANTYKFGIYNEANQFFVNCHYTTSNTLFGNTIGTVVTISSGSGANLGISNDFLYSEFVDINSDLLADHLALELGANTYDFSGNLSANISTPFKDYLTYANTEFGRIAHLIGLSGGINYNEKPFILIYDPYSGPFQRQDYYIQFANASTGFANGELITQAATNARGMIVNVDNVNNILHVKNFRVLSNNDFVVTTNSTTTIVGTDSAAVANAVDIAIDLESRYLGENALIETKLNTLAGAITKVQVISSGFSYQPNEQVSLYSNGVLVGTGFAVLEKQGQGSGYYKKKGGFLSDSKKLFDGYYYQNFSYDIISSVALDRYAKLLKDVTHQAGYIFFGTYSHSSTVQASVNRTSSSITKPQLLLGAVPLLLL